MGIMCVFEELQENCLIAIDRNYPVPKNGIATFLAYKNSIFFDPSLSKTLDDMVLMNVLLHEESHIKTPPKIKIIIVFDLIFPFIITALLGFMQYFMFFSETSPEVTPLKLAFILFSDFLSFYLLFLATIYFIGPLIFQGRLHNLEYQADFEAAQSLKNEYFIQKPSMILNRSLLLIKKYGSDYEKSLKYPRKIVKYPDWKLKKIKGEISHPTIEHRVERIRLLVDDL